jgi:hypothetical protein
MKKLQSKKSEYDKKWRYAFKPFGKKGAIGGNAMAVEVDGKVYDSLTAASLELDKSINWIKRNGKIL